MDRPYWFPDTKAILAILVVLAVIAVTAVLILQPPMDNPTLNMAIGILYSGGFTTIVNYFFGSSQASKDKDDTINKFVKDGTK